MANKDDVKHTILFQALTLKDIQQRLVDDNEDLERIHNIQLQCDEIKRYYAVRFLMSQWFIGLLKFISKLKIKILIKK